MYYSENILNQRVVIVFLLLSISKAAYKAKQKKILTKIIYLCNKNCRPAKLFH